MKTLPPKNYRVHKDFTVGSYSVLNNERLIYYVDVGGLRLTISQAKQLIQKLHKNLERIEKYRGGV